MSRFLDALRSGRVLLMDGAMGTELQRAGLKPGECGELWNLTHPKIVQGVHQAYVDAGAEVLLTNTFQAFPAVLARHEAADRCEAICRAAVENARAAAGPGCWVVGDIGPGPFGDAEAFARLVTALTAPGPDALLVETCSGLDLLVHLLKILLRRGLRHLPVLVSLTYLRDRHGSLQTIEALSPRDVAAEAAKPLVCAIGVNCGRDIGMPQIIEVAEAYHRATHLRVFARPNAGTPTQGEDRWVYPHSPEYMASWLPELLEAGVSMVGGCCGTTPGHIAAFRPIIDEWNRKRAK
jgi:5-methyltetrahydrofolate--homocysteine methyltransferase